jgi:hypothetical protein
MTTRKMKRHHLSALASLVQGLARVGVVEVLAVLVGLEVSVAVVSVQVLVGE